MSDQKVVQRGGMGICGWMFLLFLGLKLGGVISWSWWWVTAPLWIPLGVVGVLFAGLGIWLLVEHKRGNI